MTSRRKAFFASAAAVALSLTGLGLVSATASHAGSIQVGVILPDTASSNRWATYDAPDIAKACTAAKLVCKIDNAQGSAATFATLADADLTAGAKVLIMTNLDSASAKAVQDKAKAQGVATIDYDRLTLNGDETYYVSFDNTKVGVLQGKGIQACLNANAKKGSNENIMYLDGSPTDNNATLFKAGYDSVLRSGIKAGRYHLLGDQAVPGWDPAQGLTIFQQMFSKLNGAQLDAVVSANEGLALGSVLPVLKNNNLAGKVCVSGQDATDAGLAAVVDGNLAVTIFKPYSVEATAAVTLAAALVAGKTAPTNGKTNNGTVDVPSVLATPVALTKSNVYLPVQQGQTTSANVCKLTADPAACAKLKW